MIDIDDIARQVRENCHISDARHAGTYSICTLALRLRDLYKWEHRLLPWQEAEAAEILEWIDAREQRWETLLDQEYRPIRVADRRHDPFDTAGINARLAPTGMFYGAGYAHGLKPTFLLARIERHERVRGHPVWRLEREWVRDLLTLPAYRQDDAIVLRQESGRMYLWDRMAYLGKSGRPALNFALRKLGMNPTASESRHYDFDRLFAVVSRTFLDHEIGEIRDRVFPRPIWQRILAAYPHTPVELAARALKDLLADTGPQGTLRQIIKTRDAAALGLFTAFFDDLRKEFFPELRGAFSPFADREDWRIIRSAVDTGFHNTRRKVERMMEIFENGCRSEDLPGAEKKIEQELLESFLKRN